MIGNNTQIIKFLSYKDENLIFELKEYKPTRSNKQNNLYWAYITDIKTAFENKWIFITIDELHEWFKTKFIKWNYVNNSITWQRITQRKSTTELNKKEFSRYIKDIELYLIQQFEISVPLRTDLWYTEFNF